MSSAATSRSAACGRRALILSAAAAIAGVALLMGGVGGASATSLALCLTTTSSPTASPPTAPAGTPITYTATVTAESGCTNGSPTGSVTFYSVSDQGSFQIDSPVQLQPSGTSGESIATLVDNSLPRGTFAITALYTSSDTSVFWNSSSSTGTTVVIQSNTPTTTTMDFTEDPSTITVGQTVTFYVHITPVDDSGNPTGSIATGTVHFSAGPTAASGQVHFQSVQLDSTGSLTFSYSGFVPGDYIVVASYTGDPQDYGVSAQLPLTVLASPTAAVTSTTIVANPSSISVGDTTTLNAHVVETATQTPPPAGGTVSFFAGPNATSVEFEGNGILDANGNAQVSVANFTQGSYVVRAQYLGSGSDVVGSSGDSTLLVSTTAGNGGSGSGRLATSIAYTGDVEGVFGAQATLTGHLEQGNGNPLSGEPLTLSVGSQSCTTPPTTGSGNASCTITLAQSSNEYPVTATFAGDSNWSPATDSSTFTIDEAPTQLTYTGATSGASGAPATLSAHLAANGADLAGRLVTLTLDTLSCTGTTDPSGVASCTVTPTEAPGPYTIAAHFTDAAEYLPSDASATFTVTAVMTSTTYTGPTQGTVGASIILSAHVTGAPDGQNVAFTVGAESCNGTLSGGNASCPVTLNDPPGTSYTVEATYGGDAGHQASFDSKPFTVNAIPTTTMYTGAVQGTVTGSVTLSAHVTGAPDGENVTFTVGAENCSGTLSGGNASCAVTLSDSPGTSYTVTATYSSDGSHATSSASKPFTVNAIPTTTMYTGATQGLQNSSTTLSAHVTGAPNGATETVTFTIGSKSCTSALVGGNASCSVALTDPAGSGYSVSATYNGDGTHTTSSVSAPFTIVSPVTSTTAGAIAPVLAGTSVNLTATVTPSSAPGTVTFSVGGTTLCIATLSAGAASCSASFAQPGSYNVTARYAGNGVYPSSSGTATVLVYAFAPGGGSFVVGDKSASGSITFWGAQWSKLNTLSGGVAPNAFKGFALNGSAATCGVPWSTDPGNSSPPPAGPLPAYMAVIVTSKAAQSGSQISGNTVAIVIVKTSAGYASDPGHAGTGTVVATVCGG